MGAGLGEVNRPCLKTSSVVSHGHGQEQIRGEPVLKGLLDSWGEDMEWPHLTCEQIAASRIVFLVTRDPAASPSFVFVDKMRLQSWEKGRLSSRQREGLQKPTGRVGTVGLQTSDHLAVIYFNGSKVFMN